MAAAPGGCGRVGRLSCGAHELPALWCFGGLQHAKAGLAAQWHRSSVGSCGHGAPALPQRWGAVRGECPQQLGEHGLCPPVHAHGWGWSRAHAVQSGAPLTGGQASEAGKG